MQRLVYALLAVTGAVALALGAQLVSRWRQAPPPALPTSLAAACADAGRRPLPTKVTYPPAPLEWTARGVELRVDGQAPGSALSVGTHRVEATSPGAAPTVLELEVSPAAAVLLEARVAWGAVTLLALGVHCTTCPPPGEVPSLEPRPRGLGSAAGAALAASKGDWLAAAEQVRAAPPGTLSGPAADRLRAVVLALAGHPDAARALVARLPRTDALVEALGRHEAALATGASRETAALTARWNALSERFERLSTGVAAEAPERVTALTLRMDQLSAQLQQGFTNHDLLAAGRALQQATSAVDEAFLGLRAQRPTDCAWQARLTTLE